MPLTTTNNLFSSYKPWLLKGALISTLATQIFECMVPAINFSSLHKLIVGLLYSSSSKHFNLEIKLTNTSYIKIMKAIYHSIFLCMVMYVKLCNKYVYKQNGYKEWFSLSSAVMTLKKSADSLRLWTLTTHKFMDCLSKDSHYRGSKRWRKSIRHFFFEHIRALRDRCQSFADYHKTTQNLGSSYDPWLLKGAFNHNT